MNLLNFFTRQTSPPPQQSAGKVAPSESTSSKGFLEGSLSALDAKIGQTATNALLNFAILFPLAWVGAKVVEYCALTVAAGAAAAIAATPYYAPDKEATKFIFEKAITLGSNVGVDLSCLRERISNQ